MSEAPTTRRLAAILAADVVGYSRMMGGDEAGTLAALKRHREKLFDPAVSTNSGRVVKLIGDGTLVPQRTTSTRRSVLANDLQGAGSRYRRGENGSRGGKRDPRENREE